MYKNGKYFKSKNKPTSNAEMLYNKLREKGIKCELESPDKYKTVDIAIKWAKLYIEVDGKHHTFHPGQFIRDAERDHYSHKEGFFTKRITNQEIEDNLEKVAESIAQLARKRYYEMKTEKRVRAEYGEKNKNDRNLFKSFMKGLFGR